MATTRTAAVTGGTGVYQNARGSVEQHYSGNFEYDAIFHLSD